ncbi:MAG: hypothetical protein JJU42_14225 [Rhodobacteraceae bacterium]|nr:hypothetical protein [Paracoccaceae bacterium]
MPPDIASRIARITALLQAEFRASGATLADALPQCRRRLPRRLRTEADFLAEIEPLAAHPRLARQLDLVRADTASTALLTHLQTLSRGRRRMDLVLSVLGSVAFGLLAMLVLLVLVLRWRGDV